MRTLTHIILRRINNTLRISLPLEFVQKHDLKEGDHAMWIEEEDGVKLKFAKLAVSSLKPVVKIAPQPKQLCCV